MKLWIATLCTSCSTPLVFTCETSPQCDLESQRGVCEPGGACSLRDDACPEGRRYVDHAPPDLASRCVEYGGLVGHWKFDDGFGGMAADASGLDNVGYLARGPVWTTGISDGALGFDGTDDIVEIPTISTFGTASFSTFVWVKSSDRSFLQARVIGAAFVNGYWFVNFGNGVPELEAYDSLHDFWGVSVNPGTNVADDRWHHLGFVVDREHGESRMYLDGAFQRRETHTSTGDFGIDPATSSGLRIGGQNETPTLAIAATIDEVRMYTSALDDAAARAVFDADAPR